MQYKANLIVKKINSSHKHTIRETTLDRELQSALGYRDTLLSTQLVTGGSPVYFSELCGKKTLTQMFEDKSYIYTFLLISQLFDLAVNS